MTSRVAVHLWVFRFWWHGNRDLCFRSIRVFVDALIVIIVVSGLLLFRIWRGRRNLDLLPVNLVFSCMFVYWWNDLFSVRSVLWILNFKKSLGGELVSHTVFPFHCTRHDYLVKSGFRAKHPRDNYPDIEEYKDVCSALSLFICF